MSTLRVDNIENSSGGSAINVPGAAKAWVNFNGTGTVAIRASLNVSSITDNGTGDYTVNFTSALTDANYAVTSITGGTNSAYLIRTSEDITARTSSAFRTQCATSAGSAVDPAQVNLAVFR